MYSAKKHPMISSKMKRIIYLDATYNELNNLRISLGAAIEEVKLLLDKLFTKKTQYKPSMILLYPN